MRHNIKIQEIDKQLLFNKLPLSFYQRNTFQVAKELLGKILVTNINGKLTAGKIVELEPYLGGWDKASHSYPNKLTPRTKIQFKEGGFAYIFLIYGIYSQLCIVTEKQNIPDVILIRALEPVYGIDIMYKRRYVDNVKGSLKLNKSHKFDLHHLNKKDLINLTNGPGKLTKAMGITTKLYGESLTGNKIWVANAPTISTEQIACAPRIGIDYAEEFAKKPWRFYIRNNIFVSKIDKNAISWEKAKASFYN